MVAVPYQGKRGISNLYHGLLTAKNNKGFDAKPI
jgi:hypothetical protein